MRRDKDGHPIRHGALALLMALALMSVAGCRPLAPAATNPTAESTAASPDDSSSGSSLNDKLSKPANKAVKSTAASNSPLADPYWTPVGDDRPPLADVYLAALAGRAATSVCIDALTPRNVSRSESNGQPVTRRWKNPVLEKALNAPGNRPDLHLALQASDPAEATNAAIVLAHAHDPAARDPLRRAIESPVTNLWQRRAAIDAWADLAPPGSTAQLRRWIDQLGAHQGAAAAGYVPEVHAELIRALVHCTAPGAVVDGDCQAQLAEALTSPAAIVRREALVGFADSRFGPLPSDAVKLTGDADPKVRQAALIALAARRHAEAPDRLQRAASDQDPTMRVAAALGYRLLAGDAGDQRQEDAISVQAKEQLHRLASDPGELTRMAALAALAELRDADAISQAATDRSWRVRRAAALAFAENADPRFVELAVRLTTDSNMEVAHDAIESLAHWPLVQAGPGLLAAMGGSPVAPRKLAAEQLAKRWPTAASFDIDAPADRRLAAVEELQQRWRAEFTSAVGAAPIAATAPEQSAPTPAQVRDTERLLPLLGDGSADDPQGASAAEQLKAIGLALPAALDQIASAHRQPIPEAIYRDVLPAVSDEFRLIELINPSSLPSPATSLADRRQAAEELQQKFADHRLSKLALARLSEHVTRETDALIWLSAFSAIAGDAREPAVQLACAGLSHPAPEVRRRACQQLAAHPDARQGPLLLKSLADADPSVVEAAIRALGRLRSLDDPQPLEAFLASSDHHLRVAAAEALAMLGVISGPAALERLSFDPDPKIRLSAATAMGAAPEASFLPDLIRMLDDRAEIRRAALAALPLAAGQDLPIDATDPAAGTPAARARLWKQWYAKRAGNAGGS